MKREELGGGVFCREGVGYFRYLAYWIASLFGFYLCEVLVKNSDCHVIECALDSVIPFCEVFVIFYVLWYFLLVFSLVWFGIRDREDFRKLLIFLTACQLVAIVIFVVYPSKQLLRPEAIPRNDPLSRLVALIYSVDTNTNVCPSLHAAFSMAMISVWSKDKVSPRLLCTSMIVLCALAAVSTVFVKQHSVVDILVAAIICVAIEAVIYHDFWKQLFTNKA